MKKFPVYKQLDMMDCGPSCIRMVAKYYGKNISLEALRSQAQYNREGVSLLGISQAAESIGFKTRGTKITFDSLFSDASLPGIIHWNQNHFVVVPPQKYPKRYVTIADPASSVYRVAKKDFIEKWCQIKTEEGEAGIALLMEPTAAFFEQENHQSSKLGWGILTNRLWKYRKLILQLFLGVLIGSLLQVIIPFLTQSIVDTGINGHNLNFISLILIAQFMLFFGRTVVDFIRGRILLFISTRINITILSDFWFKLVRLPMNFFDTKMTGDILQRLGDHHRIEQFLTGSALNTFFSLFNFVIFSIILVIYDWKVFFIFLTGSALYFTWISVFLRYRRSLDQKRFSIASKENNATMQLIHGMQEIKLNGSENLRRWEWENIQASIFNLSFKSLSLSQYQQAGAFFINEGKNILITFFIAKAVVDGQITLGAMLSVQYIIGSLNSPIEQLIQFVQQTQDAKISLERLNEIHQLEDEEPIDKELLKHLPENKNLEFKNLLFTYPGAGNEPVLKNLNFIIPHGKVTAIVGMSGSGKTTLLKLLLRFYDNYSGDINIGGINLKYISPRFWRSRCGSVMQEGYIFSDTIAKNIAVSEERPDHQKLLHACKVANILSFIEGLPLGFNTKIGAEGNGISQGQKQRMLIARAVYKNPDFLFFDEATNALDANNEKIIMENLQEFFQGKTVVVVAHRLSTVKNADNIIVLHNGLIIEEGPHSVLSSNKGYYYELVKNQLELGA